MKEEIKIVAKTKTGEMLKGFIQKDEMSKITANESVYLRLAKPGNTLGTMICQDQLTGFFLVKSFEGKKDAWPLGLFFDAKRNAKKHITVITGAVIMASLSLIGLITLL